MSLHFMLLPMFAVLLQAIRAVLFNARIIAVLFINGTSSIISCLACLSTIQV
jgi:hypothetical protein